MYVRWLDDMKDPVFAVTHLPGARNPTDPLTVPLSRRGFADGDGPAPPTRAPPPPSAAVEEQWSGWGGLDRHAADDGFDMIQKHVDLLSCKVHAVSTATNTAIWNLVTDLFTYDFTIFFIYLLPKNSDRSIRIHDHEILYEI